MYKTNIFDFVEISPQAHKASTSKNADVLYLLPKHKSENIVSRVTSIILRNSPVHVMLPPWYDAVVNSWSAKHVNGLFTPLE